MDGDTHDSGDVGAVLVQAIDLIKSIGGKPLRRVVLDLPKENVFDPSIYLPHRGGLKKTNENKTT